MIIMNPSDVNKGEIFLTKQFKITNVEEMWEIENHHENTTIIAVGETNDE